MMAGCLSWIGWLAVNAGYDICQVMLAVLADCLCWLCWLGVYIVNAVWQKMLAMQTILAGYANYAL
jgi:hypothetical protein